MAGELAVDLGGRIPHVWTRRNGHRMSTLDLLDAGSTVFTGPDGRVPDRPGAPVRVHQLEPIEAVALGVSSGGALWVRPDGLPSAPVPAQAHRHRPRRIGCGPVPSRAGRSRRHDHDAGGDPEILARKAALRDEVWTALTEAKASRFPGARNRISNFIGAEKAAERLRETEFWQAARTVKANPDSAQLPVRERALKDGKTVFMAVPRLAEADPFFLLDPDHLADPPRRAASISGATRSARRVPVAELTPVDLVVSGCVAVGEDGARLGKGGGFADLEFALASEAGLIGPDTLVVTTVHELQVRPACAIPTAAHDAPIDLIITPERIIDCRSVRGERPADGIRWSELTEEKIAAIPLLGKLRPGSRPGDMT